MGEEFRNIMEIYEFVSWFDEIEICLISRYKKERESFDFEVERDLLFQLKSRFLEV